MNSERSVQLLLHLNTLLVQHQGYLIDQFATSIWNKRNDKYGGSLEDRLRLPIEILDAIKGKAGKDFPVTYRYGLKHYMKGPWAGALGHEDFLEAGREC